MVLTIGSVNLPVPFMLAPMAGISDLAFRLLAREFGCPFCFTEMVNARALGYGNPKTIRILHSTEADKPLGVQLLAADEGFIRRALDALGNYQFSILDFNAACPVSKVVRRGEGAGLLLDPPRFSRLVQLLVTHSPVPVTVKLRSGWDGGSINAREMALRAEDAGASAVFIHGRTKVQGYRGKVDYGAIRSVKEALGIPVIGSGDVLSARLAKKMLDETGCDGVAIARGSFGNPWIFAECRAFLADGTVLEPPATPLIVETALKHLDLAVRYIGETMAVINFRKFFIWYTKGFARVRVYRDRALRAKTKEEMVKAIEMAGACRRLRLSRHEARETA